MKLVIARYDENVYWAQGLDSIIIEKAIIGNVGREAHSYLHYIITHYEQLDDVIFCQGNPFDHCRTFLSDINNKSICAFGEIEPSSPIGLPRCEYVLLHEYCKLFKLPVLESYYFSAGAQYRVIKEQLLSRSLEFYKALYSLAYVDEKFAYTMERLWPVIWGITLLHSATHQPS